MARNDNLVLTPLNQYSNIKTVKGIDNIHVSVYDRGKMTIRLLDNATINQIAAGEVIERPASVIKELVENALDAGATQIGVEIRNGGIDLMRVTDNGSGIRAAETALAFERHATSKIKKTEDLQHIQSLGFRGEALPSIAAAADVEMVTNAEGEQSGTYLALEGGNIITQKSQARTRGTTMTARNLFRRVPARLKFLKSTATETGHVANAVSQYALAYPEVAFTLTVDGRVSLQTTGKGRLADAVLDIYGAATSVKMLPVENVPETWQSPGTDNQNELPEVTGLAGAPELGRSSRDFMSFFVNRRWVNSRTLSYAVEQAYNGLLMTGKHPVTVLNISIPPEEVDVNIHPAKSEVKFRNEAQVFRAVQKAVRRALTEQMGVKGIEDVAAPYKAVPQGSTPQQLERLLNVTGHPGNSRATPSFRTEETAPRLADTLPVLRVAGQVLNCYILAEGPDGLYIIDQHAAHERVRYDKVLKQREQRQPETQGLLEPATYEAAPRQDAVMRASLTQLAEFGFGIEPFGDRTYLVRSVPAMVGKDWPRMLKELLDTLTVEEKSRWEEKITASIACHGAIKRGQSLNSEEMRALVRQLEETSNPHTCPHGRPTVIRLSGTQLEREFGRS
jgi:DNA mismatch repair protein MutL